MTVNKILMISAAVLLGISSLTVTTLAQSPPNIRVNNYVSSDKVKRGGVARGAVEIEIPQGYHVNSNKPLEKFLIPTQLQIEAPPGVRVGPITYPRALLRQLKFSKNRVSVYEGKAVMRFNITAPANYSNDSLELKGKLRYQSCSDDLCFPPVTKEMNFRLNVVK
jgi:DsbC/DsbD-like thiol-disulfide interchange protein